jgi:hypothetical protein
VSAKRSGAPPRPSTVRARRKCSRRELDMLIQQRPALAWHLRKRTRRSSVPEPGAGKQLESAWTSSRRAVPLMVRGIGARWWMSAVRVVTDGQAIGRSLLHLTNSDDRRDLMKEWRGRWRERPRDLTASAIMPAATAEVAHATLAGRHCFCRRHRLRHEDDQILMAFRTWTGAVSGAPSCPGFRLRLGNG